jgi:hypothetical protein
MQKHIQVLGILNIVWGSFGLLGALILLAIFGGLASLVGVLSHHEPGAMIAVPILALVGAFVVLLLLVTSAPAIIVGIALIKQASWARVAGIVLSALHLLSVPLGTALGIYGLWVLLSENREPSTSTGPIRI